MTESLADQAGAAIPVSLAVMDRSTSRDRVLAISLEGGLEEPEESFCVLASESFDLASASPTAIDMQEQLGRMDYD